MAGYLCIHAKAEISNTDSLAYKILDIIDLILIWPPTSVVLTTYFEMMSLLYPVNHYRCCIYICSACNDIPVRYGNRHQPDRYVQPATASAIIYSHALIPARICDTPRLRLFFLSFLLRYFISQRENRGVRDTGGDS